MFAARRVQQAGRHGSSKSSTVNRTIIFSQTSRCFSNATGGASSLTQPSPAAAFSVRPFGIHVLPLAMTVRRIAVFQAPMTTASSASSIAPSSTPLPPIAPSYAAPLPTLAPVDHIDPSELIIEESTVRRLKQLQVKHGRPVHLRVMVDQGGCSGLEYKFNVETDTEPNEDDMSVNSALFTASSVVRGGVSWPCITARVVAAGRCRNSKHQGSA